MALAVVVPDGGGPAMVTLERKLWLTEEGKVVEDGDESARFLLGLPGDEISQVRALELGLVKKKR